MAFDNNHQGSTAVAELNHSTLMKLNKDALVNYVKNLANLVDFFFFLFKTCKIVIINYIQYYSINNLIHTYGIK